MKKLRIKHLQTITWRKLSAGKIVLYSGIAVGIIIIFFALVFLFFPQTYLNGFLKYRIIDAFTKAYPEYSLTIARVNFNVLKNRIECDSISVTKNDSTFSCRIGSFSLDGIGWIKLIRAKNFSSNNLAEASLNAKGIVLNINHAQNQILCGRLHLSVPDSEIVADSVEFHPLISDEQFFAESKFRTARYRFVIPKIYVNGLDYSRLFSGNNFRTRSINIRDAFVDVLVNMDKPFDTKSPSPLMPNEGLSSIKDTIRIDSLQVTNSRLNYNERYAIGAKAAIVTFDKMQVLAEGIVNHTGRRDTIVINAQGNFMNTSKMELLMLIPLGSPQFSFSYSGSLQQMEVSSLNKFLEIAEQRRINSGILHEASFNVNVHSGHATGYVRVVYSNLSFDVLNKKTGRGNGIFDMISSFIGKTFIIRGNNMPGKSGSMKIGIVKFTRKPDEPFIQFTWFALRSGIANVVGF
ncbi:MAG: hypothetical protein ACYC6P_08160 [Ignavibacteriaceae bacterium]